MPNKPFSFASASVPLIWAASYDELWKLAGNAQKDGDLKRSNRPQTRVFEPVQQDFVF